MNYRFLLSTSLCLAALTVAQPTRAAEADLTEIKEAPLREVTVFPNQARVSRTWNTSVKEGSQTLLLEGLEYGMNPHSIQVSSATAGVTVRLVEIGSTHVKNILSEQAKELRAMIDKEEAATNALTDELSILQKSEALLTGIEIGKNPSGTGQSGAEPIPVDPARWGGILDDMKTQETVLRKKQRELERRLDDRQVEMQVLLDRIQRLTAFEVMDSKLLTLTVEAREAGPAAFDLSYQVRGPGWFPHYQARVDRTTGTLELSCYSMIFQGTGRSWTSTPISVSTANPDAGADIPDLKAWYLREDLNPYLPKDKLADWDGAPPGSPATRSATLARSRLSAEKAKGFETQGYVADSLEMGDSRRNMEAQLDEKARAETKKSMASLKENNERKAGDVYKLAKSVEEENSQIFSQLRGKLDSLAPRTVIPQTHRVHEWQGQKVCIPQSPGSWYDQEFRALTPGTIPSTSEPVRVLLARHDFKGHFHHLVRPRQDTKAYLIATAENTSGISWLQGGMRVFFQSDFVGQTAFNGLGDKGTLELSLGVDENVKVERRTRKFDADPGLFGSERRTSVEVTIEVKNLGDDATKVRVEEALPHTGEKDSKVELVKDGAAPGVALVKNKANLLQWELALAKGETRRFTWSYIIAHEEELKIKGFQP